MESIKNPLSEITGNQRCPSGRSLFSVFRYLWNIILEMCKNEQNKYNCNLFLINVINNKYTLQKHGVL